MDTFVVRVYRSEREIPPDHESLRGVVEEISTGSQATFHDTEQLLSILYREGHEQPEMSPPRAQTPRAIAPPHPAARPGAVHQQTQPSPTKGRGK